MGCKILKYWLGFGFLIAVNYAGAQAYVPVHDMITEQANTLRSEKINLTIGNSSTQISAQVSNSTKALAAQQDDMNRQEAARRAKQYVIEQRKANAERFSVKFGAKVKDACAMVKGAQEVHSGQIAKQKIYGESKKVANRYIERGRYRSKNEPSISAESTSLLTKFQRINSYEKMQKSVGTNASMVDRSMSLSTIKDETGRSPYSYEFERKMLLLNPFSDTVPENYDSPNQPASQMAQSAKTKWKNEMVKAVAENELYLLSNKATTFSDEWANSLFEASDAGVKMKEIALGDSGTQGYYGVLETYNKSRMFSADWIKYIHKMTPEALQRDANMMAAQQLVNQSEIIRLLVMLNENAHISFANDSQYYWKEDSTSTTPQ